MTESEFNALVDQTMEALELALGPGYRADHENDTPPPRSDYWRVIGRSGKAASRSYQSKNAATWAFFPQTE